MQRAFCQAGRLRQCCLSSLAMFGVKQTLQMPMAAAGCFSPLPLTTKRPSCCCTLSGVVSNAATWPAPRGLQGAGSNPQSLQRQLDSAFQAIQNSSRVVAVAFSTAT